MSFILVVDPDAESAAAIEQALTADGLEVKVVADPDAALQVAAAYGPRLIIVSSDVPRADSLLESFARARGGPGTVAVVAGGSERKRHARELGADEILVRPFSEDELKSAVERCWSAERVSEASPSPGGRQLSSEEIFGDVLAELAGDEDADLDEGEALIEDLQEAAESLPEPPQEPAKGAVPDVDGDVNALLAGALSDLHMEPSGAHSKAPPSEPKGVDAGPVDEPSIVVEPPVVEAPAPDPGPPEPFGETPVEHEQVLDLALEEAPDEGERLPSMDEASAEDWPASTVEEVEALAAVGADDDLETESRSRVVLIGAVGGTAVIGVLLVVLLNFIGKEEPGTTEQVASPPVRELELPADESPLVGQGEDPAEGAEGEVDAEETAQQPEATPEASEDPPPPELPEETHESGPGEAAEDATEAANSEDLLLEVDEAGTDAGQPEGTELPDDLGGDQSAEEPIEDQGELVTEEFAELAVVTVDEEDPAGDFEAIDQIPEESLPEAADPQQPAPVTESPVAATVERSDEAVPPVETVTERVEETAPAPAATPVAAEDTGEAVAPGPGVVQPKLKSFDPPPYPRQARQMNKQGTVVVSVLVDETGKVVEAKLLRGALARFDKDVLKAVRRATFEPATKDGTPVSMWKSIAVQMRPTN